MAAINNDWAEALKEEYRKPYYRELYKKINEEYRTREIFPPSDEIFSAFHLTPLKDVKVVILGQDPYHNNGQAHGLSFSVKPGVDIPPSLVNIYKELHDDLGCYIPNNGYLVKWAKQGVLLLNTVLTVRAHQANSHRGIGWEEFTDAAIRVLNAQDRPIVFLLWGRPAQNKKPMLTNPKHLILEAPHPSPLSAYRELIGRTVISSIKEALKLQQGITPQIQHDIIHRMARFGVTEDALWDCYKETYHNLIRAEFTDILDRIQTDDTLVTYTSLYAHLLDQLSWGLLSFAECRIAANELDRKSVV